MYFKSIRVNHFRRLGDVNLEPSQGLNGLTGPNGSGKTSMLEAIWMLTRVRSFRTSRIQEVIQHGQQTLLISARIAKDQGPEVSTGLEKGRSHTRIRYNGEDVRTASEQAVRFPVQMMIPESHQILSGGPRERRRWLDWGTFHVEPGILVAWRDYILAMRQRNKLLRGKGQAAEFSAWEESMQSKAEQLTLWRSGYLKELNSQLPEIAEAFGLHESVRLSLDPGWDRSQPLAAQLGSRREGDRELGYTSRGPHRADVLFEQADGRLAVRCFSRGQQKQLLLSVALARCQTGKEIEKSVLLIDDLPAELDSVHLRLALETLASAGVQVFVSSAQRIDSTGIPGLTMFHVEQGHFCRL